MMSKTLISLTVVLFCFILGKLDLTDAQRIRCCESHTKVRVPFNRIVDYRVQSRKEGCRIDAIIFITIKQNEICAPPKGRWPRRTARKLRRSKLKKSKPDTGVPAKTTGQPSVPDGSGYSFNTPRVLY